MDSRVKVSAFDKTEINWDKLDKTKLYVVGAGLFTGVTLALYPVSVIKTRMQVASKDTAQNRALAVFRNILKADGIPGLYRGFGTVVTGAIPARIIFLTSLETTKVSAIKIMEPFNLSEPLQAAISNGMGGMAASVLAQAVFVPIDVVSQKLMVQGYSGYRTYNGGLDVAQKIIKADGIRGLYRGFGLSVMTYSPSSAIWWAIYGSSQRVIWRLLGHSSEQKETVPHQWQIACVQGAGGIIAGAVTSCVTTPLDTIKTRLQVMDNTQRQTAGEVIKSLIAQDGWKGLYRGLGPSGGLFGCCCCTWAAEAFTTASMITGGVEVLLSVFFDLQVSSSCMLQGLETGDVEGAKGIFSLPSTGLASVLFKVMDNRGKWLETFPKSLMVQDGWKVECTWDDEDD
ncbi:hypothetical protein HPP92_019343 [Vanilla planifolia]|uniref:Mitochondrial carrier protein n=1 Tax=Vanilla planifolia TaxID=51239 RepID=A0A835Q580_VANPL|nr:hypothetical protein HPP92_019343 [Vanilla planifolia]